MKSNQTQSIESFKPLCVGAEQILSISCKSPVHINKIERLTEPGRRNLLLRCFIEPIENLPASFMIKKVETENYNPDDANSRDTKRLFNDWVGSQFLNTIGKHKYSPRFYGGDRNLGFIVIEDVQHQNSLVEPLLGKNRDRAESALLRYATCMGQLHRDTLGKAEEFHRLYKIVSPKMKPAKIGINILKHQQSLEKLGIEPEATWLEDLETIHQTVNNPGGFSAYIHTDACPDNVLNTGQEMRLIDFETGLFGHVFLDAVFGRMMFPSCWCSKRLPHEVVKRMENTYREILMQKCPRVKDDKIFETALVHCCGWWLLCTLSDFLSGALIKDEEFGVSTLRQRILARLEAFIAISQECEQLPGLRSTSSQLLDLLSQSWLDIPELELYPAFLVN